MHFGRETRQEGAISRWVPAWDYKSSVRKCITIPVFRGGESETNFCKCHETGETRVFQEGDPGVAVKVVTGPTQAVAGVRWYNNDMATVFPRILAASGFPDLPPLYGDGLEVAGAVSGAELGWSEVYFHQNVASQSGHLYLIFQLPANEEARSEGEGPGFGYREVPNEGCVFVSRDGDQWARLQTDYELLVEPIYTAREPGMVALSASRPGLDDGQLGGDAVPAVIDRTELMAPYPNPFNPAVNIAFALKEAGPVELAVYDVRGRQVRSLHSGFLERGHHLYIWNGRDHLEQRVASGVYLAQMRAGDVEMVKRMLLLK